MLAPTHQQLAAVEFLRLLHLIIVFGLAQLACHLGLPLFDLSPYPLTQAPLVNELHRPRAFTRLDQGFSVPLEADAALAVGRGRRVLGEVCSIGLATGLVEEGEIGWLAVLAGPHGDDTDERRLAGTRGFFE